MADEGSHYTRISAFPVPAMWLIVSLLDSGRAVARYFHGLLVNSMRAIRDLYDVVHEQSLTVSKEG